MAISLKVLTRIFNDNGIDEFSIVKAIKCALGFHEIHKLELHQGYGPEKMYLKIDVVGSSKLNAGACKNCKVIYMIRRDE